MPPRQPLTSLFLDKVLSPILVQFKPLITLTVSLLVKIDAYFYPNSTQPTSLEINLPPDYEQRTAKQKLDFLWSSIKRTEYPPGTLPAWRGMFRDRLLIKAHGFLTMDKSFDNFSDIMPPRRAKFIHPYGVVGKIEFKPVDSTKFTGLFDTGAIGVMRCSLASHPGLPVPGYSPGFGLKLLRDGMASTNTVAFWKLDGNAQNSDFFLHPLLTWLPWPRKLIVKTLALVFSLAEPRANILPVRDFALYNADGSKVDQPRWPNVLSFETDDRLKNYMPDNIDSRAIDKNNPDDIRKWLLNIPPGRLFKVFAQNDITTDSSCATTTTVEPIYIADLNLLPAEENQGGEASGRGFKASAFGDAQLFFRHQRKDPKRSEKFD